MKKLSLMGLLIALITLIFSNIFGTIIAEYYENTLHALITSNIEIIVFIGIVLFLLLISYQGYLLYTKYIKINEENKTYKKFIQYGASLLGLQKEIEKILSTLIQKGEDVSLYILYENQIYNFMTLPYDTTGIHHHNKVFKKDKSTIIGTSFFKKEVSIVKISEALDSSMELKKSIFAYQKNKNSFLTTIPVKDMTNKVTCSIQIISKNKLSKLDLHEIKSLLIDLNNLLEKIYRIPNWESLVPSLSHKSLELKGSCIFFDLSNSSKLLELLPLEKAQKEINNFIAIMCDTALDRGGKIDKYTGDGAFITFNLISTNSSYKDNAINSAIEMVTAMNKLRIIWLNEYNLSKEDIEKFKVRIGVSSGTVVPFTIGHKDYKYETFMGKPIHTAYHLCEGQDLTLRDRILIDNNLKNYVNLNLVSIIEYNKNNFTKSVKFSQKIYEIVLN